MTGYPKDRTKLFSEWCGLYNAEALGCTEAVLIYPQPLAVPLDTLLGGIRVRSVTFAVGGNLEEAGTRFLKELGFTAADMGEAPQHEEGSYAHHPCVIVRHPQGPGVTSGSSLSPKMRCLSSRIDGLRADLGFKRRGNRTDERLREALRRAKGQGCGL